MKNAASLTGNKICKNYVGKIRTNSEALTGKKKSAKILHVKSTKILKVKAPKNLMGVKISLRFANFVMGGAYLQNLVGGGWVIFAIYPYFFTN